MAHEAASDNPYTRGIAEFVSGLHYEAIPPTVLTRIKLLMLDSLGCAIYGTDLEWSRILQRRLGELDTTQACAVWGTRQKLSAPHAALVNGTQVQGFELGELTAGFGSAWQTMGVALKFYSCVGSNHTTLDAIRLMQQERPFGADDVAQVIVHGSQVTMDHVGWKYVPQGLTSAQLNLPYCVATWLLDGDCFVNQFTEDKVADPLRMKHAEKVQVRHDAEITSRGSKFRHMVRVEVHLVDGTKMERTVEAGRGNENNFASEAEVVEKFEKLATHVLPRPQVEQLRDAMLGLESLKDAAQIARLMTKV